MANRPYSGSGNMSNIVVEVVMVMICPGQHIVKIEHGYITVL